MWPYQPHFQNSAEIDAGSLLKRLDPDFNCRLFLVGFLEKPQQDRHTICVVPDECVYQPELFAGTLQHANELGAYDPNEDGFHTHPIAQEDMICRKKLRGLQQAVQVTVDNSTNQSEWVSFVSWPVLVEGFYVLVVLQLSRADYGKYYHLERSSASGRFTTPFSIQRSLIESTVNEFLSRCAEVLSKPEPGRGWRIVDDFDHILRSAGKRMMDAPAIAGGNREGLHGHFEACEALSTLLYEGAEGKGRLYYVDREHPSLRASLSLVDEISLRDFGAIRKALQLASGKLVLFCDSARVYALGHVDNYDSTREDIFEVEFERQFSWRLMHGNNVLMRVRFGRPELPLRCFSQEKFQSDLARVFKSITPEATDVLAELASRVAEQKHGAMLVISAKAEQEANRLENQCTRVKPFHLTEELVPIVTSIDGAVLIDVNATCHAIGVILDGLSHFKCTPTRGARYNSAVRYVYTDKQSFAVVKSEDGQIDILPDLKPLVRKGDIDKRIEELRGYAQADLVDRKSFYDTMNWLDNHRFYLDSELCEEVNRLWPIAEKRMEVQDWLRQFPLFAPSQEMNESYFEETCR
jgi:hypothetical protein